MPYPKRLLNEGEEIALDLDMASAICPNCKILLVEATSANLGNLGTAVNTAVTMGAFATRAKATWARLIRKVSPASSRRVTTLGPHPRPLSRVAGEGSLVMQMDCHPFA